MKIKFSRLIKTLMPIMWVLSIYLSGIAYKIFNVRWPTYPNGGDAYIIFPWLTLIVAIFFSTTTIYDLIKGKMEKESLKWFTTNISSWIVAFYLFSFDYYGLATWWYD